MLPDEVDLAAFAASDHVKPASAHGAAVEGGEQGVADVGQITVVIRNAVGEEE